MKEPNWELNSQRPCPLPKLGQWGSACTHQSSWNSHSNSPWEHQRRCSVIWPLKHKSISMGKVLLSSATEEILFRTSLGGFGFILILNSFHPEILGLDSYILRSPSCLCRVEVKKLPAESVRQSPLTFPWAQCAFPSACLLLPGQPTCSSNGDTGAGTCPALPALPQGMCPLQTGRTEHTECSFLAQLH